MAKTAMIRARIEPKLKEIAESVLDEIGLTPTSAITMFYRQIATQRCLPIDLFVPNAETRRALREARTGGGMRFDTFEEMIRALDAPEPRRNKRLAKRKPKARR